MDKKYSRVHPMDTTTEMSLLRAAKAMRRSYINSGWGAYINKKLNPLSFHVTAGKQKGHYLETRHHAFYFKPVTA